MQQQKPIRIIIADDDLDEVDMLKIAFEKHPSFEVVACVNSGQEILDAVQKSSTLPDIVFTDMYMPVVNGLEAIEILRMDPENAVIRTIIFSTTINPSIKEKTAHLDITGTLLKPFTLDDYENLPSKVEDLYHGKVSGNTFEIS